MKTNRETALWLTEGLEGWHKFTDNPKDHGGATWSGVTQGAYDHWRLMHDLPEGDVCDATDIEINDIYLYQYWQPVRGDDLPTGLDILVFDIAVNQGVVSAAKLLQRQLPGVKVDGHIGLVTLNAARLVVATQGAHALIYKVHKARLAFWRRLKTWVTFGKGWTAREMTVYYKANHTATHAAALAAVQKAVAT